MFKNNGKVLTKRSIGAFCIATIIAGANTVVSGTIQCDSVITEFASTDNSQIKIKMLRDVLGGLNQCSDQTSLGLVRNALSDKRPSVVEEAVFWTGKNKYTELSPQLANLFYSADKNYPGSQSRIQDRIIVALGIMDTKETQVIFKEILERGNIDNQSKTVLESISDTTGAVLLPTIKAFADKMSSILSTMSNTPENSYKYSQCRQLLSMAQAIITKNTSR